MADPNTISDLINQFQAVTLGELENAPSMNRVDVKYVIPAGLLPDLLEQMKDKFRILDIGNTRLFPYESTYFDTSDFLFYHQHMTGRLQRYKVRYRMYVSTGTGFLEVKTTTNKKRTVKRRISLTEQPDLLHNLSAADFLIKNIPVPAGFLKPSVVSRFKRITLTGLSLNERITIDSELSFSGTNGVNTSLPFISVIELKKERSENTS